VTSWAEFLGDDAEPERGDDGEGRRGWFGRLRESLAGSRQALTQELFFNPADSESWERFEEALIRADVGVPATVELVQKLEAREPASEGELVEGLQELVEGMMTADGGGRLALGAEPAVIHVVGVNGTGKTTTIGKLASRLRDHGHSVVVAAADTFRAAADEQLEIWADRAGPISSARLTARILRRSPSTRSKRPRRAGATSSSWTLPDACTRRRTSWKSSRRFAA
jgi:fused signal recognition particle receptor